ncbi:competence/damage-inducible protein A [candidate division KSB1 bacterium]|nr:competence/damage-inducible protein A [candidate division KSB1 bacterium]
MRVEIISVGDELLIGQTVNTNASWMGQQLLNMGVVVDWVTIVGDSHERLKLAMTTAASRADVVIITGGLGPTHDDITKAVVADYFGARFVVNEEVLERVRERFRKRGLQMAKVNEGQALVPENAEIIVNELGTAPGMVFRTTEKLFYVMPGVPGEMKAMMMDAVLPQLKTRLSGSAVRVKNLMTTGVPESALFERLDNLDEIQKYAKVAFLPNLLGVKIRILAKGNDDADATENLRRAEMLLRDKIGGEIFTDHDISLEETVAALLVERGETIAVAESCTGGMIANRLTNIPGSSRFFDRSIVAYSNSAKMQLLQVPAGLIDAYGAVSFQVAQAMAAGARTMAQTDYGLSVTGIAGPGGGTAAKPVGLVFIGYADENETVSEKWTFADDRIGNKQRATQAALNLLRKKIMTRKL